MKRLGSDERVATISKGYSGYISSAAGARDSEVFKILADICGTVSVVTAHFEPLSLVG